MSVQMKSEDQNKTFEWKGLACVYIPTRDVVKASEWYYQVLGMKASILEPGSHAMLSMPGMGLFLIHTDHESTVNFYKEEGGEPQAAWCFSVKNIEELYSNLKANNVQVTELNDRDDCGINFQFYDPDGNYFDVNDDHRIFVPLNRVKKEEEIFALLKRKIGSKEALADWDAVTEALGNNKRLPCRFVLHGWEEFGSSWPAQAAELMQRLEKHNEIHADRRAEVIVR
ncbi:VOC family protein [Paenibacillus sp. UNC451MF]|uniref:VOC family protein n=1 Tax=Paenibacillus sp. UNC451MF TaxID=1449063 RepID=UPI0006920F48|nr:VOC family protein [Paenibacillus sp. UNC451MF]